MERLVRASVHRLVVVNETRKVLGIISLSDLLRFFIRAPPNSRSGSSSGPQVLTASEYDICTAPNLDQSTLSINATSMSVSLLSAPSPVATLSRQLSASPDTGIPLATVKLNSSFGPTSADGKKNDIVSASLPPCPAPARTMAYAGS